MDRVCLQMINGLLIEILLDEFPKIFCRQTLLESSQRLTAITPIIHTTPMCQELHIQFLRCYPSISWL